MPKIDEVKKQLKEAGLGRMELWSSGRELFALANALGDQERIEAAVAGRFEGSNGYAVATSERVLFVGGGIFKQAAESLLYDKISSVQAETKRLTVYASGNSATLDKIINPNSAKKFADFVRAKLAVVKTVADTPATAAASSAVSAVAEQIELLVKLREQGILTEDEFQTQKLKLLERL